MVPRTTEHWDVVIHLVNEDARPQDGWPKGMKVGDSVHFVSPDGEVKVEFKAQDPPGMLPFTGSEVEGAKGSHTVVNACKFMAYCFVKPRDKPDYIGWNSKDPRAGTQGHTGGGG